MLNGDVLPAWAAEVLDHIVRSNFARMELIVYNAEQAKAPARRSRLVLLRDKSLRRRLLFDLYTRWDRKHAKSADHPLHEVDCSGLLNQVPSLHVTPIRRRFEHRFPEDAITHIREAKLDVLIRFGFNILRGEILQSARYGVWSYHHGDNDFYRGGPAYFWELVEDNPVSGALLQQLTEELDAGKVLCKGFFATCAGASLARNRVQPYWGASIFVIQKLHQLHEHGWERVESEMVPPAPYRGQRKIYRAPTNWQMFRWIAPHLLGKITAYARRRLLGGQVNHWMLAINPGARPRLAAGAQADISAFRWIPSPRGHFYADPFLFKYQDKNWLLFEDFDYANNRGIIAAAEVHEDGELCEPVPALVRPYHLSYPCVLRVDGEIYMVPETRANRSVELYRCKSFPIEWEFVRAYMKISAVDTTVWMEDGLCWFFVTMREDRGGGLQLWLFYSTAITEDWTAHPANPISTDIRSSRGGGAIFREGSRLIRPSQDCSGEYGRSFTLNEIVVLNQQEYRERPYLTVTAPDGMIGTHTYSQLGNIEVSDGCKRRPVREVMQKRG